MATCPSCRQENPEIARFCLACGAALDAPAAAPQEERKLVSGLFVDLVGSTARSEHLDPEDVRSLIAPYHAAVRRELLRFGGTVEKFIGDAVFALFGAPVQHEDDPERAVRAAFAVRDAIRRLNAANEWLDLHIRIGITTGEALVMLDAKPGEGEWMAAGDVVNTAARIQSGAPVDGILVGQLTYEASRHVIEYGNTDPVAGKGKAEPIVVWEAVGLRDTPAPLRPRLPLLGREHETDVLLATWETTLAERRPSLVTLVAGPGVGKTRLLQEVAEQVASTGVVHWGRCLSYGEGITYWPVREVIRSAAGIQESDDGTLVATKLGALLHHLPTDDPAELRTIAASASHLLGAASTPLGTYASDEIGQAELHWGLRRLFELLASYRPVVLVIEDLHWAEPTLLELVRFVAAGSAPIMILCSARPELRQAAPEFLAAGTAVAVDTLAPNVSERLLHTLLEGTALDPATTERLLENAGGNPLFLEETVRMVEAAGTADVSALALPTSLRSLIGSRLDQLQADDKQIAQTASVIGAVFWPGAVEHIAELRTSVIPRVQELERRDLVREQVESTIDAEREYAFKHSLIRDIAYERLPKGRRAVMHQRFAGWVSALAGVGDDFVEFVAYHLEQACRLAREVAQSPISPPVDEAVAALTRAAEKAERREGLREAERYYARAIAIATDETAVLGLELRRGRMVAALGDLRRAEDVLARVEAGASDRDLVDVRCAALVALANIEHKRGTAASARAHLDEAVRLASELGDRSLWIRASYESGQVRAELEGEPERAVDDLRRAIALADEVGDRSLRTEGRLRLGSVLLNVCRLGEAEDELAACTALASEQGSQRDEARAATLLAMVQYYRGDLEAAEARALKALASLERIADRFFQLQNAWLLGRLALERGHPLLAEERLRAALPPALESGGWLPIVIYQHLALALLQEERLVDARDLVTFAAQSVEPEDVFGRATVLLAQAELAAAEGDAADALRLYGEAIGLLEEQRVPIDIAEARLARARAARRLGRAAAAADELAEVRETFDRMDAARLVRAIDLELAELAGETGAAGPARL